MLFMYLLRWWYGPGWASQWTLSLERSRRIARAFSYKTLLKTLFSPWKRIVTINHPNASIQQKFRALEDNLFSRAVGFVVRVLTLIAAFFSWMLVGLAGVLMALVWPILPALSLVLIYLAVSGGV